MCAKIVLNVIVSSRSSRHHRESARRRSEEFQVASRGKKMQAQTRRHAIRNSISLERKLSQPINSTLGCAPLSVETLSSGSSSSSCWLSSSSSSSSSLPFRSLRALRCCRIGCVSRSRALDDVAVDWRLPVADPGRSSFSITITSSVAELVRIVTMRLFREIHARLRAQSYFFLYQRQFQVL